MYKKKTACIHTQVTAKMFNELDALFHFLPEFHVTIDAGRYYKVGPRGHHMRYDVTMHVALLVTFGIGQILQVQFFIFQN